MGGTVYRCAFITCNGVSDGKLYRDFVESNNATILQGFAECAFQCIAYCVTQRRKVRCTVLKNSSAGFDQKK